MGQSAVLGAVYLYYISIYVVSKDPRACGKGDVNAMLDSHVRRHFLILDILGPLRVVTGTGKSSRYELVHDQSSGDLAASQPNR